MLSVAWAYMAPINWMRENIELERKWKEAGMSKLDKPYSG
jgi:hypothetical protein